MCALIVLGLCQWPGAGPACAEIYVHIDDQGVYHFTDTPTSSKYIRAHTFSKNRPGPVSDGLYEKIIRDISAKIGVRPELVKAVIRVESGFNTKAVSEKGARGLMQLMPVHLQRYRIDDPFDPRQNITAGTRYLGRLLKRYNGNLNMCLAAYNAGPSAVDHYQGVPPYTETRQYVQKVLLYYRHYRNAGE